MDVRLSISKGKYIVWGGRVQATKGKTHQPMKEERIEK